LAYLHERWLIHSSKPKEINPRLKDIAISMEDSLLICEQVPEDAFDFLVELFSQENTAGAEGLSHFIRFIFNDFYKLSYAQSEKLLELFVDNSHKYQDEVVQISIADLIARKYSNAVALSSFQKIADHDDENSKRFAYFGLDVLRIRANVDQSIRESAIVLQSKIELKK
jgi:hypothetical protein